MRIRQDLSAERMQEVLRVDGGAWLGIRSYFDGPYGDT